MIFTAQIFVAMKITTNLFLTLSLNYTCFVQVMAEEMRRRAGGDAADRLAQHEHTEQLVPHPTPNTSYLYTYIYL